MAADFCSNMFTLHVQVLGGIIMICAAAALGNVNDLSNFNEDYIDESDDAVGSRVPDTPDLVTNTRSSASWLLFLFFATVGYEGLWIMVRFLNIGLVNMQIIIFLIVVRSLPHLP